MTAITNLEKTLSGVAGVEITITIRGHKQFTYSFDGDNAEAAEKLKAYFKDNGTFHEDSGYDEETALYCLYHNC